MKDKLRAALIEAWDSGYYYGYEDGRQERNTADKFRGACVDELLEESTEARALLGAVSTASAAMEAQLADAIRWPPGTTWDVGLEAVRQRWWRSDDPRGNTLGRIAICTADDRLTTAAVAADGRVVLHSWCGEGVDDLGPTGAWPLGWLWMAPPRRPPVLDLRELLGALRAEFNDRAEAEGFAMPDELATRIRLALGEP
jgi:hypothetical protein